MRRRLAAWFGFLAIAGFVLGCTPAAEPRQNANAPVPVKPAAGATGDAERITFTTEDPAGVVIVGDLYIPDKTPAPAVLALHQFQANRGTYREFGKVMRDAGFVVLAIDGRGFGESTSGADGKVAVGWDTTPDIQAAIEYLKMQPSVDGQRIGLIGASYGASNALIYAADDPVNVRSVALLSVGVNYHGTLPTEPALKKYGDRPLLLVGAKDDTDDGPDTETVAATVKNPKYKVQMYDKGGHGTSLLDASIGGMELVKAFFVRTLTGPIAEKSGASASGGEAGSEGGGATNTNAP